MNHVRSAFGVAHDRGWDDWQELSGHSSGPASMTRRRPFSCQSEKPARARIAHHAELVVVTTSAIAEITSEGQLLVLMNQREIGARRGLIVSGDAAGKTTAIKQLGRLHELRVRARIPAGADRIPVVYVTCPPKGSPRKLATEFARFLGLPLRTRANVTDIADAVCQVLIDARTDLVLVDEIHNLNHGTPAGEDLSDHLKYFTEHLPATFIFSELKPLILSADSSRLGFGDRVGHRSVPRFSMTWQQGADLQIGETIE